jgi:hypothetical protein
MAQVTGPQKAQITGEPQKAQITRRPQKAQITQTL